MGVELKNKSEEFVILIDDNDVDNFISQKVLASFGINNIMVFCKSHEALDYLGTATNKPSLMLIDIYMPLMNGEEFIEEFKKLEISKHSPDIYFLSSSMNPKDKDRSEKKGVGFVEKPLTSEKLIALVESIRIYANN